MNSKKSVDIGAIGIIVVLVVGFIWILVSINPTKEQVDNLAQPVEAVNKDLLRSKEVGSITSRTNNGNLPYKPNSDQLPKDNPFASLE